MEIDPMAIPFVADRVSPFGIPAPDAMDCFAICGGNLSLLVCAARFLWPRFVQVGDVTVRAEAEPPADNIAEWVKTLNGDLAAVERIVNHLHVDDLITSNIPPDDSFPDQHARPLAEAIARSWAAALIAAYPRRSFRVEAFDGDDSEQGAWTDATVTFWEDR